MSLSIKKHGTRKNARLCLLGNSINYAYQKRQFSVTRRQGIIEIIPKKDAEPFLIKNWRPITLLNWDYKIVAKALVHLFLCAYCSFLPLFLCAYCSSVPLFLCSSVLLMLCSSVPLCLLSLCSSVPTVPLCLLFLCSSVPTVPLFLCANYFSVRTVPTFPLFLCSCVPTVPTVPLFLCAYYFSVRTVPLFLCAYVSSVPVCLLFLLHLLFFCSSVPTVPLCLLFLCSFVSESSALWWRQSSHRTQAISPEFDDSLHWEIRHVVIMTMRTKSCVHRLHKQIRFVGNRMHVCKLCSVRPQFSYL